MSTIIVDCGNRTIQNNYRVALTDILKAHGLKPGDKIGVKIEIKKEVF